jgi:hypothetical protein
MSGPVERQQIDPPASVLPLPEFLGYHQQIVAEHSNPVSQQTLKIAPFVQAQIRKLRWRVLLKLCSDDLEEWHRRRLA